jgi:HPt (histidine-containing phosphotransfer) domain-containing protein
VPYVTHTEQQRFGNKLPLTPDEEFEEVRRSFLARLHGEQANLATLAKVLECTALDPGPAFGDLAHFAHRLRGAAAVFEFPTLCDAAKALELAAADAMSERAPNCEPRVQKTMRSLNTRLTALNAGTISLAAEVALAPAN